jgi:hypothetical protein
MENATMSEVKRVGHFPVTKDGYECGLGAVVYHPDSEDIALRIVDTQEDMAAADDWRFDHPTGPLPRWVGYYTWYDRDTNAGDTYIFPLSECYAQP